MTKHVKPRNVQQMNYPTQKKFKELPKKQEQARDAEKRLDPFVFQNEAAYSPVSLK